MKRYIIILSIFLSAIACQKEEVPYFEGKPGITFYVGQYEADSTVYSFAYDVVVRDRDTMFLDMRVMGAAVDYERKIRVVAGAGTTAREGMDYILPETWLPAGELIVSYPVVLINTPEMAQQAFLLVVEVMESEDLRIGATGREIGNSQATKTYKINISNILEQPSYWAGIERFFGPFSAVRYRFMVETLGITDFSSQNIGVSGTYNYPLILQSALEAYEAENGPLIDENDQRVTF